MSTWIAFASRQTGGKVKTPSVKVTQKRKIPLIPYTVFVLDKPGDITVSPSERIAQIQVGPGLFDVYQLAEDEGKFLATNKDNVMMTIERNGRNLEVTDAKPGVVISATVPATKKKEKPLVGVKVKVITLNAQGYQKEQVADDLDENSPYDFVALQNTGTLRKGVSSVLDGMQHVESTSGTVSIVTYYHESKVKTPIEVKGEFGKDQPFHLLGFEEAGILFINLLASTSPNLGKTGPFAKAITNQRTAGKIIKKLIKKGKIIIAGNFGATVPSRVNFMGEVLQNIENSGGNNYIIFNNLREVDSKLVDEVDDNAVIGVLEY